MKGMMAVPGICGAAVGLGWALISSGERIDQVADSVRTGEVVLVSRDGAVEWRLAVDGESGVLVAGSRGREMELDIQESCAVFRLRGSRVQVRLGVSDGRALWSLEGPYSPRMDWSPDGVSMGALRLASENAEEFLTIRRNGISVLAGTTGTEIAAAGPAGDSRRARMGVDATEVVGSVLLGAGSNESRMEASGGSASITQGLEGGRLRMSAESGRRAGARVSSVGDFLGEVAVDDSTSAVRLAGPGASFQGYAYAGALAGFSVVSEEGKVLSLCDYLVGDRSVRVGVVGESSRPAAGFVVGEAGEVKRSGR